MKSTSDAIPMRSALFGALSMAWAWGVIAGSVGLNALIKSNQTQSSFKKKIPPPTVLTINVNDVFQSGVVLTTVAALIATLCTLFMLMFSVPHTRRIAIRSLRTQSLILAFCATWLFAALVPFTVFFATRSAKITAKIGNITLPQGLIQQTEQAMGTTSVYKKIGYLRLVAIIPWFTILFTVIASTVMFMASSRVHHETTTHLTHDTNSGSDEAGTVEKAGDQEK